MIGADSRRCNFSRIKASGKQVFRRTSNLISIANDRRNKRKTKEPSHIARVSKRQYWIRISAISACNWEESQPWERSDWFSVALHDVIMKWIMTRSFQRSTAPGRYFPQVRAHDCTRNYPSSHSGCILVHTRTTSIRDRMAVGIIPWNEAARNPDLASTYDRTSMYVCERSYIGKEAREYTHERVAWETER